MRRTLTLAAALLCACGSSATHPDGGDAGSEPTDAGFDAGDCAPLAATLVDAGPANFPPPTKGCVQDLACPVGDFCYSAFQTCVSPASVGYNAGDGTGGTAADGGACQPTLLLPASCDATSLDWAPSADISRDPAFLVESDTVLAADGHGNVVAGWAKIAVPSAAVSQLNQLAVSHDDGVTFTRVATPADSATSAANDATLAYANGLWTYVWEGYPDNFQGAQHVFLATSPTGDSWGSAAQVDSPGDFQDGGALDFPWVSVSPATQLPAVSYTVDPPSGTNSLIRWVSALPDGGFGASQELDDGTRTTYAGLAQNAFDSAGSFYAAWQELNDPATSFGGVLGGGPLNAVYFTRLDPSPDGGWTRLGPDVKVNSATDAVTPERPALAVTADGSKAYIAYEVGTANAINLEVVTSSDRGQTWTAPVVANDDGTCATHFHASAIVDARGRLWLLWYDNRDGHGHFFYSVSDDGGQTFHPNRLVSAPEFPFDTFQYSCGWLGDYFEPAIANGELYALWSDGRESDQSHAFFAKAPLP